MMRVAILVAIGALTGPTAIAHADEPRDEPAAIEVDREIAPPGRAELGFDAGGAVDGWAASVSFGYLRRPITLSSNLGESAPVTRRATVALGAALALGDSAVVDIRFPMAWQEGDRLRIAGDPRGLDRWVPGDLRAGGRVRVVGTPRGSAFIRGEVSLPTGDARDFAGEASWSLAWSLIGRAELPAGISLALTGGIRLRGAEVLIADRLVGDELFGGVGILVPVPPIHPLWCVRDQVKLTAEVVGILGDDVANKAGPSPAEARLGLVTRPLPDLALGVRVGAGLSDEIGTPRWRATIELTYQGHGRVIPRSTASESADGRADDPDDSEL
jgi:hypothetical protein